MKNPLVLRNNFVVTKQLTVLEKQLNNMVMFGWGCGSVEKRDKFYKTISLNLMKVSFCKPE